MGRALGVLLLLCSCARTTASVPSGPAGPLQFRVLAERAVSKPCVDAPQFGVALDEGHWIDVFDMETSCRADATEIPLPDVDFETESAVAAWWTDQVCPGAGVQTVSVARAGAEIVVIGVTHAPTVACTTGGTELESFLAIQHSELYDGTQRVRFMLDGEIAGRAKPGGI